MGPISNPHSWWSGRVTRPISAKGKREKEMRLERSETKVGNDMPQAWTSHPSASSTTLQGKRVPSSGEGGVGDGGVCGSQACIEIGSSLLLLSSSASKGVRRTVRAGLLATGSLLLFHLNYFSCLLDSSLGT